MGDLRTTKTYRSLCTAFLELLESRRFEEISIQQLCDKAEIRRATFYTHFADKYDFLSFFIRRVEEEFVAHVTNSQLNGTSPSESYYIDMFHELISFFELHPAIIRNHQNSQVLPTILDILAEEIQENIFQHLQDTHSKDEQVNRMKASFYAGGIIQLFRLWMTSPESVDLEKITWME